MNIFQNTSLAAVAAAGLAQPAAAQSNVPPNVLMICADDLKPTLGCFGDSVAITPNIDRLAERGTAFSMAYCTFPVCGPSRASIMSGLMPEEVDVLGFTPLRATLPDLITLPQHFKNNGYETVGVGKIHDHRTVGEIVDPDKATVGGTETDDPLSWTLPFNWGGGKVGSTQVADRDGRRWPLAAEAKDQAEWKFTDPIRGSLMLDHLTTLAAQYRDTGKPFFATVGFARPHLPFLAPPAYWDLYERNDFQMAAYQAHQTNSTGWVWDNVHELQNYYILNVDSEGYAVPFPWNGYGEPWPPPLSETNQLELIHGYYACVSMVDAQVGLLLDKLEAEGISDNTIVVFLGDHGFHLGDHNKWAKHTALEQAARAPLIISAPGIDQTNTVSTSRVSLLDVYPTLCDLAGLEEPMQPVPEAVRSNYNGAAELPLSGSSLVPMLGNPDAEIRDGAICCYRTSPFGYSYRTERYRYIEWILADGTVRARELFDYQTDPNEATNIAVYAENEPLMMRLASQMRNPPETPGCMKLHNSIPESLSLEAWYNDWAAQFGINPINRMSDSDGDGFPDLLEHAMGGNPLESDNPSVFKLNQSRPGILSFRRQRFSTQKGLSYRLEHSTNIVTDIWDPIEFEEAEIDIIDPSTESVTARIAVTNSQAFIRLRIEETP